MIKFNRINCANSINFTYTSHFRYKSADEFITMRFYALVFLFYQISEIFFLAALSHSLSYQSHRQLSVYYAQLCANSKDTFSVGFMLPRLCTYVREKFLP